MPTILDLSFQMGEVLLENGAEISRVQETMERVACAYRVDSFQVYVLTNAIFATGVEQGVERTAMLKHIPSTTTHLGRICAVNQRRGQRLFQLSFRRKLAGRRRGFRLRCGPGAVSQLCRPERDVQISHQPFRQRVGHLVRWGVFSAGTGRQHG